MTSIVWRGKMKQRADGLWVRATSDELAREVKASRFRRGLLWGGRKRTIYDNHGNPMGQITVSDAGNSHHEYKDRQDAVARPDPVSISASLKERGAGIQDLPAFLDTPPVWEAEDAYNLARKKVRANPESAQAQADWHRAKVDLNAARMLQRLNRRA